LAQVIRERRAELGLTQEELAERIGCGVRQADVSRLERGRVVLPRRDRLERIAAALDLAPGELLVRSGWAGADRHLDTGGPRAARSSEPPRPAETPFAPPALTAGRLESPESLVRSERLRLAIERSREIQAQAAQAQQRARESFNLAMQGWARARQADVAQR
jgi:transcriptional regulator with XRE-family HTH domain